MGRNIVKAKLDIIFKTMFSKSENEDILHSFLSTMLELPYDKRDSDSELRNTAGNDNWEIQQA